MTRPKQIILRHAAGAVLYTIGCVGLVFDSSLALLAWAIGFLVLMGSKELHSPIPKNEMWQIPVIFVVILALVFLPRAIFSPLVADEFKSFAHHPLFIFALWVLLMWGVYTQWRREVSSVDA